jgi:hypothetical protein
MADAWASFPDAPKQADPWAAFPDATKAKPRAAAPPPQSTSPTADLVSQLSTMGGDIVQAAKNTAQNVFGTTPPPTAPATPLSPATIPLGLEDPNSPAYRARVAAATAKPTKPAIPTITTPFENAVDSLKQVGQAAAEPYQEPLGLTPEETKKLGPIGNILASVPLPVPGLGSLKDVAKVVDAAQRAPASVMQAFAKTVGQTALETGLAKDQGEADSLMRDVLGIVQVGGVEVPEAVSARAHNVTLREGLKGPPPGPDDKGPPGPPGPEPVQPAATPPIEPPKPVAAESPAAQAPAPAAAVQPPVTALPTTPDEVHTLAKSLGVESDNAPAFMDATEHLTGTRHLDKLKPHELQMVGAALQDDPWFFAAKPAPPRAAVPVPEPKPAPIAPEAPPAVAQAPETPVQAPLPLAQPSPVAVLPPEPAIQIPQAIENASGNEIVSLFTKENGVEPATPSPFNPADHVQALQDLVRGRTASLAPKQVAKALNLEPDQAQRVMGALASRPDSGVMVGKNGMLRRAAIRSAPMDVNTFVAANGGIKNTEGHDLGHLQKLVPGYGPLIRPNGKSLDAMGEALWQDGYFGPADHTPRPTENDVLQLLTDKGKSLKAEEQAQTALAQEPMARTGETNSSALADIHDYAKTTYPDETLTPEEATSIMDRMGEHKISAEAAVDDHIERKAIQDVESVHGPQDITPAQSVERAAPSPDLQTGLDVQGRTLEPGSARVSDEALAAAAPDRSQALPTEPVTLDTGQRAEQTVIPGAERASEQQLAAAADRRTIQESQQLPRANSGKVQKPNDQGLFAPPEAATGDLLSAAKETPQKTEPAKPSSEMIQDAGEKIGGARKDRWAERGLNLSDLQGMSEGEAFQHVTKDQVWPKPDYAKMVENGATPEAAAYVKIIRDRLAGKPSDSAAARQAYTTMMGHVRDVLSQAKTVEDVKAARDELVYNRAGLSRDRYSSSRETDKPARDLLWSVYKGRSEPFRGYGDERKISDLVKSGFPEKAEPWTRRFDVRPHSDGTFAVTAKGKWRPLTEKLATRPEAEAAAKTLYEDALGKGEAGKTPERPHLDKIERTGADIRAGKNVGSEDFVKNFGFRGVEFGNWVASDERQKSVNLAYDGLHDLANTLEIPPKALSLDGHLGLAFGARGSGKFAAHYEPGKLVINLTKMSGAGSLAHEWGHALDHYFGELDTPETTRGEPKGASGWYKRTEQRASYLKNLRPEMAQAFDRVMGALFKRDKVRAEAVRDAELRIENLQASIATQKERAAKSQDQEFVKRSADWIKGQEVQLKVAGERLANFRDEKQPYAPSKVNSSYYEEAMKLSGKARDDGYWARPTEMFARAFESYVFDKIGEQGNKSQYLVQGVEPERYATGYKGNPYPVGMERGAINGAFDHLFQTMDTREGAGDNVALFKRREGEAAPTVEHFAGDTKATYTPEFDKARAEVAQELRSRLNSLGLKDIGLKLPNTIETGALGKDSAIDGFYLKKIINVALDTRDPLSTVNHEAIHALKDLGLFTKFEWNTLRNKARTEWVDKHNIKERYGALKPEQAFEEAIAHEYSAWSKAQPRATTPIGRIFQKVRDTLRVIADTLRGTQFNTADDIFGAVDRGTIGNRLRDTVSQADGALKFDKRDIPSNLSPEGRKSLISKLDALSRNERLSEEGRAQAAERAKMLRQIDKPPGPMQVKPVEGTGELHTRGLSQSTEASAIDKGLLDTFGELPEYRTVEDRVQGPAALKFLNEKPDKAMAAVMENGPVPKDVLRAAVYVAVKNRAEAMGDSETLRMLATRSPFLRSVTTMGQEISYLRNVAPNDPVAAIKQVQDAREAALQARGVKVDQAISETVKQIKAEVRKTSSKVPAWNAFIDSIVCK